MALYVAHYVVRITDVWFNSDPEGNYEAEQEIRQRLSTEALSDSSKAAIAKTVDRYFIDSTLFEAGNDDLFDAGNAEAAYARAAEGGNGVLDSDHDGPGDLTIQFSIGIHDLERVSFHGTLLEALSSGVRISRLDARSQIPKIRAKDELSVFRELRLLLGGEP